MTTHKKSQSKKFCLRCAEFQLELGKMKEMAGRAQADLQNAKERMRKEGEEIRKFALENTLVALLPTMDNLQRAFNHLPQELSGSEWVKGVQAIWQDLSVKLTAMGLKKIECIGEKVDPAKHEVIQTGLGQNGVISEVFEDGYMFNGKVIRAAKVKIGSGSL